MTDATRGTVSGPTCPAGVPPEDVAAFVLDGEPSDVVDLAAHVPTCPTCTDVVRTLPAPAAWQGAWAAARREVVAPAAVADRALARVRAERRALAVAATLGAGWGRVLRAGLDRPDRGRRG